MKEFLQAIKTARRLRRVKLGVVRHGNTYSWEPLSDRNWLAYERAMSRIYRAPKPIYWLLTKTGIV